MKLAFVVNDVATELHEFTTTRLARAAARRDHEVWLLGVGDVSYREDDRIAASAFRATYQEGDELEAFLERARREYSHEEVVLDDFDVVMLRNDTVEDVNERPWAATAGIQFGYLLAERGVTVLNDPAGLSRTVSKLYLQDFPADIRPISITSRDPDEIVAFVQNTGPSVIKPMNGAQGKKVFMVESADDPNLHQAIEAVLDEGYATAQEWIQAGDEGDMRLFLLEGELLQVDGTYAAVRRLPRGGDPRANISTGAKPEVGKVTELELAVVDKMRDRLLRDGMFFVGIDLVGDKVIEVNFESPGGMQSAEILTGTDFCDVVIAALEKRISS